MKKYLRIQSELFRHEIDRKYLGELIGRGKNYISSRFCGNRSFTVEEAYLMLDLCGIPHSEFSLYFPPCGILEKPTITQEERKETA